MKTGNSKNQSNIKGGDPTDIESIKFLKINNSKQDPIKFLKQKEQDYSLNKAKQRNKNK